MVPDDQYLDWRYTRQWEKDWTEVFLNYGNSHVVGTVSFQAFGLTDAEHISSENLTSQLGIAQAYVTLTPTLGPKWRFQWKVGAFWDKYGMSGKYDAGKYDMYLFGRTHTMGESAAIERDVGSLTFKLAQGLGVKDEQIEFTALTPPYPGFTLVEPRARRRLVQEGARRQRALHRRLGAGRSLQHRHAKPRCPTARRTWPASRPGSPAASPGSSISGTRTSGRSTSRRSGRRWKSSARSAGTPAARRTTGPMA